jgi:Na+/H+ antiporter NhaC
MVKAGFIKSIQKNTPFKKLSTSFISLAMLFILSIVLYFVFNKQFREGNTGMKKADPMASLNQALNTAEGKKDTAKENFQLGKKAAAPKGSN